MKLTDRCTINPPTRHISEVGVNTDLQRVPHEASVCLPSTGVVPASAAGNSAGAPSTSAAVPPSPAGAPPTSAAVPPSPASSPAPSFCAPALPAVCDLAVEKIELSEALRYLGYRGQSVDSELLERINKAVDRVLALARPRAALRAFAIEDRGVRSNGTPELRLRNSALVLSGTSISSLLVDASTVTVMAVTLGMQVERELRRLSLAGNTVDQMLFDAAATAGVEHAADAAEAIVVAHASSQNMFSTRRFSPGYGDLPLACQATLLASVDAGRRLGITLTDSKLLVPTKSVTAVMGSGHLVQDKHRRACDTCELRERCTLQGDE